MIVNLSRPSLRWAEQSKPTHQRWRFGSQPSRQVTHADNAGSTCLYQVANVLTHALFLRQNIGLQIMLTSFYAAIIYKLIIPNRTWSSARLLGFGFIMPSALMLPHFIIDFFGLVNKTLRMGYVVLPFNVFFRTIEAMFGTSPPAVEDSLTNYILYMSSCADFKWTKQGRVKATTAEIMGTIMKSSTHFVGLSIMISFLQHFQYKPFPSDTTVIDDYSVANTPNQLANNYLYAILTFFALSVAMELAILSNNFQGFSSDSPFRNPLFASTSPSDFWGRRWNRLIHQGLKRGAYEPMRKVNAPPRMAKLAAFLASGLLHEYTWSLLFYIPQSDLDPATGECLPDIAYRCYYPKYGKQCAFFLICGVLMLLEGPVAKLTPIQWMAKNLPLVVRSTLVVLTVLPVGHWFTGDWIAGGYFEDHAIGLFKIAYTA